MVLGATDDGKGIYIWWCLFVNNQFRLLEEGQTQDTNDFFHVFGQQVEGIGKMLMCSGLFSAKSSGSALAISAS